MTRRRIAAWLSLAVLALAGCSSAPTAEQVNMDACDAFAFYLQEAGSVSAMDRRKTIEQIHVEIDDRLDVVDEMIAASLGVLENAEDGSDGAWEIGADMMAGQCMELGWEP